MRTGNFLLPVASVVALLGLVTEAGIGLGAQAPTGATKTRPTRELPAAIITAADMTRNINSHKGQVVLLHLWASWCAPCLQELPIMGKFARDMKTKGVQLISVSLDDPTPKAAATVSRLINERALGVLDKAIVRIDDTDAFISAVDPQWEGNIPALFAYDRSGHLARAYVGEATRRQLERLVTDLVPLPEKK